MDNLMTRITFMVIKPICLKKRIELPGIGLSKSKITIEDLPVLVNLGVKFHEEYPQRTDKTFFFNPEGIVTAGESIYISKEEFEYFLKHKQIEIIS